MISPKMTEQERIEADKTLERVHLRAKIKMEHAARQKRTNAGVSAKRTHSMADIVDTVLQERGKWAGFGGDAIGGGISVQTYERGEAGVEGYEQYAVCETHGEYVVGRYIAGRGFCRVVAGNNFCPKCFKAAQTRRDLANAGYESNSFGARFAHCTVNGYDVLDADGKTVHQGKLTARNAARDFVRAFLAGGRNSMIFSGRTGCGKNHLAAAISHELTRNGYSTHMILAKPFVNEYYGAPFAEKNKIIKRMVNIDLLVIDEMDKFNSTKESCDSMFELLNERYLAQKPTIVMTNFNEETLKAHIGEFSYERLKPCVTVSFYWESNR